MIKVLCVFGTRPEAIKMAPLVKKISSSSAMQCVVCVTAQHREMLDQVLQVFNITPDYDLNLMHPSQTLTSITADILTSLSDIFKREKPSIVLVHGDTTTSFASALAAFYEKIPIGHVEAGLRSFNPYSPFPEEINRKLTSRLATLHFAPTETNIKNLRAEGTMGKIYKTGNTVIDALFSLIDDHYLFRNSILSSLIFENRCSILLTIHRRENLGDAMKNVFQAILQIVQRNPNVQFIYPIHKNPAIRDLAEKMIKNHDRIFILEPLEVDDMYNLIRKCSFVMTDSGGLQEEAPALGKPVLVLREETERPEAVEMGTVKIIGTNTENILFETERLILDNKEYLKMSSAVSPYGDGKACERICDAILNHFENSEFQC